MEKITVFLADWQVLFREGIHFTLSGEEDMEVIGEDVTNEQALAFIDTNPPKVAILNANHDNFNGFEATRQVKQMLPEVSVILVMDSYNEEQLFDALKSGASACFTKDVDPDVVVSTIRDSAKGKVLISEVLWKSEIASRVLDDFAAISSLGEQARKFLARLNTREAEVLHQIADGNTKEAIASTLSVNNKTLESRLQSVHYKLVINDQKLMLIEIAQSVLPTISNKNHTVKPSTEYITKEEFTAFKESLKERFKFFNGETG